MSRLFKDNGIAVIGIGAIVGLLYWASLPVHLIYVALICRGTSTDCMKLAAPPPSLPRGLTAWWGVSNVPFPAEFCKDGCRVAALYDLTGNGFDLTQANPTSRPALVFDKDAGTSIYVDGKTLVSASAPRS